MRTVNSHSKAQYRLPSRPNRAAAAGIQSGLEKKTLSQEEKPKSFIPVTADELSSVLDFLPRRDRAELVKLNRLAHDDVQTYHVEDIVRHGTIAEKRDVLKSARKLTDFQFDTFFNMPDKAIRGDLAEKYELSDTQFDKLLGTKDGAVIGRLMQTCQKAKDMKRLRLCTRAVYKSPSASAAAKQDRAERVARLNFEGLENL